MFSLFGKELSISGFDRWDWSQMKGLVILYSFIFGKNKFLKILYYTNTVTVVSISQKFWEIENTS